MLAKNLSFLAHADAAGIVLGARVRSFSHRAPIACEPAWPPVPSRSRLPQPAIESADQVVAMRDTILIINAGSSSIKFQLFALTGGSGLERQLKGQIEGIGVNPHLIAKKASGEVLCEASWLGTDVPSAPEALERVVAFLRDHLGGKLPVAVGHRVVHGGIQFSAPTVVTHEIVSTLEKFVPLAPLHQPNNLAPIKTILERLPHITQVACFDTAFHRGHPELSDRYAIPDSLYREGVRRYGFHGLSYEFIARRLRSLSPHLAAGKVVVAHLGSGASMCALQNGRSIDSTMGLRPSTVSHGHPAGPDRCGDRVVPSEAEGHVRASDRALPLQRLRAKGSVGP